MTSVQVDSALYTSSRYMGEERWSSYSRQYSAVRSCAPISCLEVGIGNGIVAYALRGAGIAMTTCDIDASLAPDRIGAVTELPFEDGAFDCVLCAEVVEHVPFASLPRALAELCRVTRRYCVLTIPYPAATFSFSIKIPLLRRFSCMVRIPLFWRQHAWNGEHYWEMGMCGFSRAAVMRHIAEAGFSVVRSDASDTSPYMALFVLEKKYIS